MITKRIRLTPIDVVLGALLLAFLAYLAHQVTAQIHYRWNWQAIPQYLLRFDSDQSRWVPNLLLQGLFTTIRLSLWATVLGTLIGAVMGLMRTSRSLFNRMVSRTYVESIRNLPPLVLIFIFYYFISDQVIPLLDVEQVVRQSPPMVQRLIAFSMAPPQLLMPFISATITLAIFEGAYITEIVRAGIESIDKGQWEASRAIGLSRRQQLRLVIFPLVIRRILPPLSGQFVSTIKDSAIVAVISIQDLTFQGMELMAATYLTFEVWITITLMYLALTLPCSMLIQRLENAMTRRYDL